MRKLIFALSLLVGICLGANTARAVGSWINAAPLWNGVLWVNGPGLGNAPLGWNGMGWNDAPLAVATTGGLGLNLDRLWQPVLLNPDLTDRLISCGLVAECFEDPAHPKLNQVLIFEQSVVVLEYLYKILCHRLQSMTITDQDPAPPDWGSITFYGGLGLYPDFCDESLPEASRSIASNTEVQERASSVFMAFVNGMAQVPLSIRIPELDGHPSADVPVWRGAIGTNELLKSFSPCQAGNGQTGSDRDCGWSVGTVYTLEGYAVGDTIDVFLGGDGACHPEALGVGQVALRVCEGPHACDSSNVGPGQQSDDHTAECDPAQGGGAKAAYTMDDSEFLSAIFGLDDPSQPVPGVEPSVASSVPARRPDLRPVNEQEYFQVVEGARYGNLFAGLDPAIDPPDFTIDVEGVITYKNGTPPPSHPPLFVQAYSCIAEAWGNLEYDTARACAGGDPDRCLSEPLGTCEDACSGVPNRNVDYYSDCTDTDGGRWARTTTTYLHDAADACSPANAALCATAIVPVPSLWVAQRILLGTLIALAGLYQAHRLRSGRSRG
jgi:hypothetical protein